MHSWNRRLPTMLIGACLCTSAAFAQTEMQAPVGEFADFAMDSGPLDNAADQAEVLFEGTVHIDNAAWIRLYFTDTVISPGIEATDSGYVRITSALDGEVQELNDSDLRMWNDTSAYFNGDTLYVELIGAAGSTGNRVGIAYVAVEYPVEGGTAGTAGTCGICGADDRVPSAELWTARTMPIGCTASVYNEDSCMVTAGHCSDGGGDQVAQFRVPPSNEDCSMNNPPVNDQFPITGRQFRNGGVGADWSVLTTGTNGVGQKPFDRYGVFIPIAPSPASVDDTASVTGYGSDTRCTRHKTQQFHAGTITQVLGDHYRYQIDVTLGNSGSPVIVKNECVAIHMRCENSDCPQNFGTRVDNADFAASRERVCPQGNDDCVRDPEWVCDGDTDGDGQVNPVDSGLVQAAFGSTDEADLCQYDIDCDGQINPVDRGIVQSLFGTCEAPRDVCP